MAVNSVGSGLTIDQIISQQESSNKTKRNTNEMGKDQFLNLLVTQLRYQDPLNPTNDKEFIGQMAQFTQLEQLQNLSSSFSSVRGTSYLGRNVKGSYVEEATKETKDVAGVVTDLTVTKDGVLALVNGQAVPIEKITEVSDSSASKNQESLAQYTGYLGYKVKGNLQDQENHRVALEGIVKEISMGETSPQAIIDEVTVDFSELSSSKKYTTAAQKAEYLSAMKDKEITGSAMDAKGNLIQVTGTLKSYTLREEGPVQVTLNDVKIPVENITAVTFVT